MEGAASARAALSAADRVALVDGRAAAALVATRLLTGASYLLLIAAVLGSTVPPGDTAALDGLPAVPLAPALIAAVVAALLDTWTRRWVGVSLDGGFLERRWVWMTGWSALVIGFLVVQLDARAFIAIFAVGVTVHAAAPVLRWWTDRRRGSGRVTWPAGSEAFALLSVLASADSAAPERLIALAGLPPVNGDRWLSRLRSEQALFGGRRRHWLLGDEQVRLTVPGRERLDRMRTELERIAGGAPIG